MTQTQPTSIPVERMDMSIPEAFHRMKRTLLLLCSALLILALASQNSTDLNQIKIGIIEENIPTLYARWMLWLSATYYAFGFYFEFRVASLLNSKSVGGKGLQPVEDTLASMERQVAGYVPRLGYLIDQLERDIQPILLASSSVTPASIDEGRRSRMTAILRMADNAKTHGAHRMRIGDPHNPEQPLMSQSMLQALQDKSDSHFQLALADHLIDQFPRPTPVERDWFEKAWANFSKGEASVLSLKNDTDTLLDRLIA